MKFDKHFRERLQLNLRKNKNLLETESFRIIHNNNLPPGFIVLLKQVSDLYSPFTISEERAHEIVKNTISNEFFPSLKLGFGYQFWNNEIEICLAKKEKPVLHTPEEVQYRIESENFEYDCEEAYWNTPLKLLRYHDIADFDCFLVSECPANEFSIMKSKGPQVNVQDWSKYIIKLIEINFDDFIFDKMKSTATTLRFLKQVKKNISFGFEYDYKEVKYQMNKGKITLPQYFNLILINEDFSKNTKFKDYKHSYHEDIFSLGILGNPFFYYPCSPLINFASIEMFSNKDAPLSNEPMYQILYEHDRLSNRSRIKMPEEYGEKIKKHAYFYMDLLGFSSKGYLSYLEQCILDSI